MKTLNISRLSLKMFITYFISCILLFIFFLFSIGRFSTPYDVSLRERIFIISYLTDGISTYQSAGTKILKDWLIDLKKNERLTAYFLVKNKEIIGQRPIPKEIVHIHNLLNNNDLPKLVSKTGNYLVSGLRGKNKNDALYRLVINSKEMTHGTAPLHVVVIEIIISLFISSICCLFLTYLLMRPILIIKNATANLAKGKLNTRIGSYFNKRNDELVELAEDFDNMAQELESLVLSKERLLEDISHELRSPLSRQQVAIDLLKEFSKEISIKHFNKIQTENKKLDCLIEEILALAKINSSTRQLKLEKFNLLELLTNIANDANYETQQDGVSVISSKSITIKADKILINRAIENIVRNAVRYTKDNKKITLSLMQKNSAIYITISDNGPGVREEELSQIFEIFYRAKSADPKQPGGYGLGLAIAKQAIFLHGGSIKAKNKKEGGLEVTIQLKNSN